MPRRELTVATATLADGGVEVSVADTGPGLAPELEGRLFEPFATTKPEGMGVGLAISRSIVEGHGGRLEAAPRAGGGTVFRFVLPAPAAGSRPGQEAADAA
jgi:two-component system sensor kinase FixL